MTFKLNSLRGVGLLQDDEFKSCCMLVNWTFYSRVHKGVFLGQLLQKPDSVNGDANIAI